MNEAGRMLKENLVAANEGRPLPHGQSLLLDKLGLSGNTHDGKTLADRIRNDRSVCRCTIIPDNEIMSVGLPLMRLQRAVNEKTANPSQETLAKNLVEIATQQFEREGNICPGASAILMETGEHRPDLVEPELREKVYRSYITQRLELIAEVLEERMKNGNLR